MSQTITLTAEQAAAFDAGEPVTLVKPKAKRRFIIVTASDNVFDCLCAEPPRDSSVAGELTLIAKGAHPFPVGTMQSTLSPMMGKFKAVTEIEV